MHKIHLPTHPRTGLLALGFRRNGDPIWPVLGGAPEDDDQDSGSDDKSNDAGDDGKDDASSSDDPGDDEGVDQLGDKGKQALDRMKAQRNDARKALEPWKKLAEELGADSPEQIAAAVRKTKASTKNRSDGSAPDSDPDKPDPEEIRRQAKAEAAAEVLRDRVMDKIEAKAAKQFADPADAAALLLRDRDLDDFLHDGKIDVEEIDDALNDLLKKKPYLAAKDSAQGGKRFQGSADQGSRKGSGANQRPKSLSEAVSRALAPKR